MPFNFVGARKWMLSSVVQLAAFSNEESRASLGPCEEKVSVSNIMAVIKLIGHFLARKLARVKDTWESR